MCTVTFIPAKDGAYLTSNRDEHSIRSKAVIPEKYITANGSQLIYPKDAQANGTWIILKDNNDAVVLLNGACEKHERKSYYRKSRGLILLDIFSADDAIEKFRAINLNDIEPFTLVLFINKKLFEARWDGDKKYFNQLDNKQKHIWSSSTLYNTIIRSKRKKWFDAWNKNHINPTQDDIIRFHRFSGDGDAANNLMMNRDNKISTVSITSIHINQNKSYLQYFDVTTNTLHQKSFQTNLHHSFNLI